MASRPVYTTTLEAGKARVVKHDIEFEWFPGFSIQQKQRSIKALHDAASETIPKYVSNGISEPINILEVSSKSESELGVALSAFNLQFQLRKNSVSVSVESAFQCSKVFDNLGPFPELLLKPAKESRRHIKSLNVGRLTHFELEGEIHSATPLTHFYDWLYIVALHNNDELSTQLDAYNAFTDIEFNPTKSINCQANSVALYLSLKKNRLIDSAIKSPKALASLNEAEYRKADTSIISSNTNQLDLGL